MKFKSIQSLRLHPIELKLGKKILDISPHNSFASDFSIYPSGRCGARLLKSSNRHTVYSIHSIKMELARMILDISPHNLAEQDFSISSQEVLWGHAS